MISYENLGNLGKSGFGVWGSRGDHFHYKPLFKDNLKKLLRISLLHFGLVTSKFHLRKTRKPLICMVFGPGGRDHDSQINYFKLRRHQDSSNNSKRTPEPFLTNNDHRYLRKMKKTRTEKHDNPSNEFLKILNM